MSKGFITPKLWTSISREVDQAHLVLLSNDIYTFTLSFNAHISVCTAKDSRSDLSKVGGTVNDPVIIVVVFLFLTQ